MYFEDRLDAARQLAQVLRRFDGQRPLVLAIPRGAVPMGRLIADALHGELDVVLVKKLPAPRNREFAIGAIDESGWAYISPPAAAAGADAGYLDAQQEIQRDALQRRRAQYTPGRALADPATRIVIVVDDGLATGATMLAALHAVRAKHPARLVCAVPVASEDALALIQPLADELVCLYLPPCFDAVGQFYRRFPQIEDEEVIAVLRAA